MWTADIYLKELGNWLRLQFEADDKWDAEQFGEIIAEAWGAGGLKCVYALRRS